MFVEGGQRAFLVLAHEPRVACNVGGEDGGEAALDGIGGHGERSLRQAGLAEATRNGLHVIAITAIEIAFNRTQRELRIQPQGLR